MRTISVVVVAVYWRLRAALNTGPESEEGGPTVKWAARTTVPTMVSRPSREGTAGKGRRSLLTPVPEHDLLGIVADNLYLMTRTGNE